MGDRSPYIRPGFLLARVFNPINRRLGIFPTLTVRGRRSGELRTIPLGSPLEFAGARYLVSGRGNTEWARNLRAVGQAELRIHGITEPFRAVEVKGGERERVVAAYKAKLGRAVHRYFDRIPDPADHPVFRIEPLADRAELAGHLTTR